MGLAAEGQPPPLLHNHLGGLRQELFQPSDLRFKISGRLPSRPNRITGWRGGGKGIFISPLIIFRWLYFESGIPLVRFLTIPSICFLPNL